MPQRSHAVAFWICCSLWMRGTNNPKKIPYWSNETPVKNQHAFAEPNYLAIFYRKSSKVCQFPPKEWSGLEVTYDLTTNGDEQKHAVRPILSFILFLYSLSILFNRSSCSSHAFYKIGWNIHWFVKSGTGHIIVHFFVCIHMLRVYVIFLEISWSRFYTGFC